MQQEAEKEQEKHDSKPQNRAQPAASAAMMHLVQTSEQQKHMAQRMAAVKRHGLMRGPEHDSAHSMLHLRPAQLSVYSVSKVWHKSANISIYARCLCVCVRAFVQYTHMCVCV